MPLKFYKKKSVKTYKKKSFKKPYKKSSKSLVSLIKKITLKECETKESTQTTSTNLALAHNTLNVIYNPMYVNIGTGDPSTGIGNRIGDEIIVKGLKLKFYLQNQAERPKVWYRLFVIRSSSGDTISRATFFKGIVGNKMIDQIDTERFKVIYQKTLTLNTSNPYTATSFSLSGAPQTGNGGTVAGGVATKILSCWIPGKYLVGYGGKLKYKNGNTTDPIFHDYRIAIVAYDLYGTPQDVNNVGAISESYCKLYFKDP